MKELSIEEKAKCYDEAIKKAKSKIKNNKDHVLYENDVIEILPELYESDDKRIRKEIIKYIESRKITPNHPIADEWIAWLEKQGKQKPVWHDDSDEPIRGSLILLIMQSGTPVVAKIVEPNHTFNHGERWAYIDDLLKK